MILLDWQDDEQRIIACSLLKLGRCISRSHIEDCLSQRKNITPAKLKLKGKVGWDSTLPQMATFGGGDVSAQPIEDAANPLVLHTTAFFKCPHCQKEHARGISTHRSWQDTEVHCMHTPLCRQTMEM